MIVAFLGPSLPAREARRLGPFRVLPPARAGDVWRALALRPRAIAVVDGVFESQPSVWHRELLDALDAGVAVFGGASMGALRAAELWRFGMVGVGEIFAAYRDGTIIDDAEVALLHADAEHGFRPITVPLVNVRHAARRAREARVLSPREASRLVAAAEAIFYQERSWPAVLGAAGLSPEARRRFEAFPREDLKARDARACLSAAALFARSKAALPPLAGRPPPPSHARRRRAALDGRAPAPGDSATGLRRALLVSFARSLGIAAPPDPKLRAALERAGADRATADRLAGDVALEALALENADRLVSDGPSPLEAAADEAMLRRAGAKKA